MSQPNLPGYLYTTRVHHVPQVFSRYSQTTYHCRTDEPHASRRRAIAEQQTNPTRADDAPSTKRAKPRSFVKSSERARVAIESWNSAQGQMHPSVHVCQSGRHAETFAGDLITLLRVRDVARSRAAGVTQHVCSRDVPRAAERRKKKEISRRLHAGLLTNSRFRCQFNLETLGRLFFCCCVDWYILFFTWFRAISALPLHQTWYRFLGGGLAGYHVLCSSGIPARGVLDRSLGLFELFANKGRHKCGWQKCLFFFALPPSFLALSPYKLRTFIAWVNRCGNSNWRQFTNHQLHCLGKRKDRKK